MIAPRFFVALRYVTLWYVVSVLFVKRTTIHDFGRVKIVQGVMSMAVFFRGHWHGEVAVKMIEIENPTEEQLNAFKFQVGTFRKTRHENVVLFMGACMDPPKLAIITR